ncbi:MAG TPA: tetratricopeptide repeat protein [Fimbriimonadaceae bacterium]|nr:tetratricopeptide repeat protein [Fimbriimonadaceae bacterium]
MKRATVVEASIKYVFRSTANYGLARALTAAGRDEEALEAYRHAVKWDSKTRDLDVNGPPFYRVTTDYALLLSKRGKIKEAKALYYYTLRQLNGLQSREHEPAPFLVIFDPDQNGVCWEYDPVRFKVANMMLRQCFEDDPQVIEQVEKMAPDWFWPVLYSADKMDPVHDALVPTAAKERQALLDRAQRLAKPGIERDIMRWYLDRIRVAPSAIKDKSPMTEGTLRLAQIEVVKPDEKLLRSLSVSDE